MCPLLTQTASVSPWCLVQAGAKQDFVKAHEYFHMAANQGVEEAKPIIKKMPVDELMHAFAPEGADEEYDEEDDEDELDAIKTVRASPSPSAKSSGGSAHRKKKSTTTGQNNKKAATKNTKKKKKKTTTAKVKKVKMKSSGSKKTRDEL